MLLGRLPVMAPAAGERILYWGEVVMRVVLWLLVVVLPLLLVGVGCGGKQSTGSTSGADTKRRPGKPKSEIIMPPPPGK